MNTCSLNILLVEDNADIAENIHCYLEQQGHRVDSIGSGTAAFNLLGQNSYQLLILDVMLPGIDGFSLAQRARQQLQLDAPILFLTARDTLPDKLEGFEAGGDDYLTKPFEFDELAARVNALGRRASGGVTAKLSLADWQLDQANYQILYQQRHVKTTKIGYRIFRQLVSAYPNLVLRSELEQSIWADEPPDSDALRSHIFALRKAITKAQGDSVRSQIETVHGMGFKLVLANEREAE